MKSYVVWLTAAVTVAVANTVAVVNSFSVASHVATSGSSSSLSSLQQQSTSGRSVGDAIPLARLANVDYSGLGYDVINGNPHSDLFDPGFRQTVFQLEYGTNSTTNDGRWLVPDHVQVLQTVSCSYETESTEISGTSSYVTSLSYDASATAGVLDLAKFSASYGFKFVQNGTSEHHRSYVASVARCIAYKSDINYKYGKLRLTDEFIDAVQSLPTDWNDKAYLDFIGVYGTHAATTIYMGAKSVVLSEFEETSWARMLDIDVSLSESASASFKVATLGTSMTTAFEQSLASTYDSLRRSSKTTYVGSHPPPDGKWETWATSAADTPYPIQYRLVPLTDVFNIRFFPNENATDLAARRALLATAYDAYCHGIEGCGDQSPERARVRLQKVNNSFIDEINVSCGPGYSLLSCGFDQFSGTQDYDLRRRSVPINDKTCNCGEVLGGYCIAWCADRVDGFELIATLGTGYGFKSFCPADKKVVGCHLDPLAIAEELEAWPDHYPMDDGSGCLCTYFNRATCIATCASNVTHYEIRSAYGVGYITATCSPGNYVLGCGIRSNERHLTDIPPRTWYPLSNVACQCTDTLDGSTCYAICGRFE